MEGSWSALKSLLENSSDLSPYFCESNVQNIPGAEPWDRYRPIQVDGTGYGELFFFNNDNYQFKRIMNIT
jgi:hypothetical protein